MPCYYKGCNQNGTTKEHIPPKSFFPKDQRDQLLTVPSCELHNNAKSSDDVYVLAQICMNASPSNRSREIFIGSVVPQLGHNGEALRKLLLKDAVSLQNGAVRYKVKVERFDRFFTALSCGIIYKAFKKSLPDNFDINHIYHDFEDSNESIEMKELKQMMLQLCANKSMGNMNFGRVDALNKTIYSVKAFGTPNFESSITVAHVFFGIFRVTSMLTNIFSPTA